MPCPSWGLCLAPCALPFSTASPGQLPGFSLPRLIHDHLLQEANPTEKGGTIAHRTELWCWNQTPGVNLSSPLVCCVLRGKDCPFLFLLLHVLVLASQG